MGYMEMISEIRPEDFEIKYRTKNRFRFMGNGRTKMEYDPKAVGRLREPVRLVVVSPLLMRMQDLAYYLKR